MPIVDLCTAHVDCVNRTAPVLSEPTPFKMIRTTNVSDGFIDTDNVRYVSAATYKKWTRRLVPKRGDVILTREAPLGNVGKVRTDDSIFLGQRLYHFRPDPQTLDGDFLLYGLMADDLQRQIRSFGSGATVEHMRLADIPQLEILAPQVAVQRRIAAVLAAYDDLIENNRRRIAILDDMARALFRVWLVQFRSPECETLPRVATPIGDIPQGWEVKKLGEVAEEMRRNVPKGQLNEPRPYVGLEHIPRRSLALDAWETVTELGSNKLEFKKGEILFGKIRPYFHKVSVAPFDGVCSADTILIRARRPEYYAVVVACVSSDSFVAEASATANGAKMPRANWDVLKNFQVVLPAGHTAATFSTLFEEFVAQQRALMFLIQNLRRARDLLLPRLMSGQLVLPEI